MDLLFFYVDDMPKKTLDAIFQISRLNSPFDISSFMDSELSMQYCQNPYIVIFCSST